MKARAKRVPRLASETTERRFWESRDSTTYVDWSRAERVVFPNLKPTTRTRSITCVYYHDIQTFWARRDGHPGRPPTRGPRR